MLNSDPNAPMISLRRSQIKIDYSQVDDLDPSHLTIDLLRVSRLRKPGRLSPDLIINLDHNGVPGSVFIRMLREAVKVSVEPLLAWDNMKLLWAAIERAGNVVMARKHRQALAESRLHGRHDTSDASDGDALEEGVAAHSSVAWFPDPHSGCPSTLQETVLGQIEAGFNPEFLAVNRAKLLQIVKEVIRRTTRQCHFDIPLSCTGFVVPGISS
jgi:RNA-dependent RNA polymerase